MKEVFLGCFIGEAQVGSCLGMAGVAPPRSYLGLRGLCKWEQY